MRRNRPTLVLLPSNRPLDSRLRGNDGRIAALDAESAEVLRY